MFDAVLCRLGLMFLPYLLLALRLFHSALVPGGKIAAAVWPALDKVPTINLAFNTVLKNLNLHLSRLIRRLFIYLILLRCKMH